jgi:putative transposase
MKDRTWYLSQDQYDWLTKQLPTPKPKTGRKPTPNSELLNGILYVLKTGCQWAAIPESVCAHDPSSCWRRFRFWSKKGAIVLVWKTILKLLDQEGKLDLSLGHIDGSLVQSPKFRRGTGYSGKHHRTGTNAVLVTEKEGLPLANATIAGNHHDTVLAEKVVKKIRVGAKKRVKELNGDKGFDSQPFRRKLRRKGIKPNIPLRKFKKRRQKGPKPKYNKETGKFRAFVERTIAWLKYSRRLRYRWERMKSMFQAFLDLACLLICLKRVGVLQ